MINYKKYLNIHTLYKIIIYSLFSFILIDVITNGLHEYEFGKGEYNLLNLLVKVMQTWTVLLLILSLIFGFKYIFIFITLPIAYFEQNYNIIAGYLHYIILDMKIYDLFTENPYSVSPEWLRIIILLTLFFISVVLFFLKKRERNNIFLLFGTLGIITTAFLFHYVIMQEISFYKDTEKEAMQRSLMVNNTMEDFQKFCFINKYTCFAYDKEDSQKVFNDEEVPEKVREILLYVKSYYNEREGFFFYGMAQDPKAENRIVGQIPFALGKNPNITILYMDESHFKDLFKLNQKVFGILSICSHTVWFFGPIFLIWFHNRRKKRK